MMLSPQRVYILGAIRNEYVASGSGALKFLRVIMFSIVRTLLVFHGMLRDGHLDHNDVFICTNYGVQGGERS